MPADAAGSGGFSLAELHIHSLRSDGVASPAEILEHVQTRTKLKVIAITDHDTVRGAIEACELAAKGSYRFEVIPGVEITTNAGHLIALFVEHTLPYDETRRLGDYIQAVHALGGLCVAAHPMSRQKNSISRADLERLLADPDSTVQPDGIEVFEPRVARLMNVEPVEHLNRECYHLAEIGSSDAHALSVIASRYTVFPGATSGDLRRAIVERTTRACSGARAGGQGDPPDGPRPR